MTSKRAFAVLASALAACLCGSLALLAWVTGSHTLERTVSLVAPEPEDKIVAFYCPFDDSVNFATVEEFPKEPDAGDYYTIMGKRCLAYFDAQSADGEELSLLGGFGWGPLTGDDFPDTNSSIETHWFIDKICFLNDVAPTTMRNWFTGTGAVPSVEGLEHLNASNVKSLERTFAYTSGEAIGEIVEAVATSKPETINSCFYYSLIKGFDVSGWDTSAVKDMSSAFAYAWGDSPAIGNWDVSSVEDMSYAFRFFGGNFGEVPNRHYSAFQPATKSDLWWKLDLSSWQTSGRLKNVEGAFAECFVRDLDLSGFDTSQAQGNPISHCLSGLGGVHRITIGPKWNWKIVECESEIAGWRDVSSGANYKWSSEADAPPSGVPGTYDCTTLVAVLSSGTVKVWRGVAYTIGSPFEQLFPIGAPESNKDCFWTLNEYEPVSSSEDADWADYAEGVEGVFFETETAPFDMAHWFSDFKNCTIINLANVDSSRLSPSAPLFEGCGSLKSITFGEKWNPSEEALVQTHLPEGKWRSDGILYDHTDALPAPAAYDLTPYEVRLDTSGVLRFGYDLHPDSSLKRASLDENWTANSSASIPWTGWTYTSVKFDDPIRPVSCSNWFSGSSVRSVDLSGLDLGRCTSTAGMFANCSQLEEISGLSELDTSSVEDYSQMFVWCSALTDLPGINEWQVSSAKTMSAMFQNCRALARPDLSKWEIPSCTSLHGMFMNCTSLETVGDVSGWNPVSVSDFSSMFYGCSRLEGGIDLSSWLIKASANLTGMFQNCTALTEVTFGSSSGPIDALELFGGCSSLSKANLGELSNVIGSNYNMAYYKGTFAGCDSLAEVTVGAGWTFAHDKAHLPSGTWTSRTTGNKYTQDTVPEKTADTYTWSPSEDVAAVTVRSNSTFNEYGLVFMKGSPKVGDALLGGTVVQVVEDVEEMASTTATASPLTSYSERIAWVEFQTDVSPVSTKRWFYKFNMTTLDASRLLMSEVTDISYMFANCPKLESLDMSSWDTYKVTDMSSCFANSEALANANVSGWNLRNTTSLADMFRSCVSLESIDVGSWSSVSYVTTLNGMFSGCASLSEVAGFNGKSFSYNTDSRGIFSGCTSLTKLEGAGSFLRGRVTTAADAFSGCTALETIDISDASTSRLEDSSYMFYNCSSLKTIYAKTFTKSKITNGTGMFEGCISLVGGNGFAYNPLYTDESYARLDNSPTAPGYFTPAPTA